MREEETSLLTRWAHPLRDPRPHCGDADAIDVRGDYFEGQKQ